MNTAKLRVLIGSPDVQYTQRQNATGYFYISQEDALKEGWDYRTKDGRGKLENWVLGELRQIESWCNGDVYGFVINKVCPHCDQEVKNGECVESLWGIYGDTQSVVLKEALSVLPVPDEEKKIEDHHSGWLI